MGVDASGWQDGAWDPVSSGLPTVRRRLHKGLTWATRDNRPLARVHRLMFAALADTEAAAVVWMPAHTKEEDVGRLHLGDGTLLSESDRKGNEEADRLAKLAVEAHRVRSNVVVVRTANRCVGALHDRPRA